MLAEMLEKLLVSLVNNWKKYLGCFIGFVLGILLVEYGLPKTVFIIVLSIVGYKMGDTTLIKKLKKSLVIRYPE